MKNFNNLILLIFAIFALSSCNHEKKELFKKEVTEVKTASLKSVEVAIEGMTCEIGCAKTIESKLSKVEGIAFSSVNFEAKKGIFTFDQNKLSAEDIKNKIDAIAGGDLYKATALNDLTEIVLPSEDKDGTVN